MQEDELEGVASQIAVWRLDRDGLKELLGISHRILAIRDAQVVAELAPNAQERDIVEASVGTLARPAA